MTLAAFLCNSGSLNLVNNFFIMSVALYCTRLALILSFWFLQVLYINLKRELIANSFVVFKFRSSETFKNSKGKSIFVSKSILPKSWLRNLRRTRTPFASTRSYERYMNWTMWFALKCLSMKRKKSDIIIATIIRWRSISNWYSGMAENGYSSSFASSFGFSELELLSQISLSPSISCYFFFCIEGFTPISESDFSNDFDLKSFFWKNSFFKISKSKHEVHSLWRSMPPAFFALFGQVVKRTLRIPTTIIYGIGWSLDICLL